MGKELWQEVELRHVRSRITGGGTVACCCGCDETEDELLAPTVLSFCL